MPNAAPSLLLSGATGQVGRSILDRLLALPQPPQILALHHSRPAALHGPTLQWLQADLAQPIPIRSLEPAPSIEAALHAGPLWLLPPHVGPLAQAGVTRLVAFGSTSVEAYRHCRSAHDRAYADRIEAAEQAVLQAGAHAGVAVTLLRPTLIYGRGLDRNVTRAARVIERFGIYPLALPGTGLRQPVHCDDLAQAAITLLAPETTAHTAGKIYNVCGGETLSYRAMIGRLFDLLGRRRRFIGLPAGMLAPIAGLAGKLTGRAAVTADMVHRMNQDLDFDDSAARTAFGYAPRPFLAGGLADLGR